MMLILQACSLVGSYLNSSSDSTSRTRGVSVMPLRLFTSSLIRAFFWASVRCWSSKMASSAGHRSWTGMKSSPLLYSSPLLLVP